MSDWDHAMHEATADIRNRNLRDAFEKERAYRKQLEARLAALEEAIAPWFKDEPGVIQEIAGTKHLQIPLPEYRRIQSVLTSEASDER